MDEINDPVKEKKPRSKGKQKGETTPKSKTAVEKSASGNGQEDRASEAQPDELALTPSEPPPITGEVEPVVEDSHPRPDPQSMFIETNLVRKKRFTEFLAKTIFLSMTLLMIIPLIIIIGYLFYKAFPILSWDFLTTNPVRGMREGGIWSAFLGTVYLVVISLCFAAPIGVLAAVYLNEYARDNWLTRVSNLAVVNLAGVPSIVHALFGLGAFVLFAGMGRSILAAGLTLAIMNLPVIITGTREALNAVPKAFREACWNVGATRWQTIRRIVLPNSVSGMLTGVILEVSRAAGETAPIMFTGAVFYKAIVEGDPFAYGLLDQCMALSMHLFTISTQVPDVPEALPYGTAVVLLCTVLMLNAVSITLRVYLRSRKKW
ncbi:phosphate ABC transporter permease PstA [bacterium]|nr:phosphate ABC transporter permease PstA [bacterium]